jgi:hypothetical protein
MTEERALYYPSLDTGIDKPETYNKRNDRRVMALEAEVNRLRDRLVHRYVNDAEGDGR